MSYDYKFEPARVRGENRLLFFVSFFIISISYVRDALDIPIRARMLKEKTVNERATALFDLNDGQ